ncbi:MAG TPA: pitrilysin family protein [Thermoanaerobaculia bacterium]
MRGMWLRALPALALAAAALTAAPASAADAGRAEVPVEEIALDNGMRFLLVRRPEQATVMAGWVAKVGSANESAGVTGVAHFFEHMMFKGSRTIGTTDIGRDLAIIEEQEARQEKIRALYRVQRERYRRGEIDDPFDPAARPAELVELERRFQELIEAQRALMVKDEFDKIYTEAGGSSMNAGTADDWTIYFITVPANKLELWFWMESERLLQPVFREFYAERDVVQEERRLRIESTPTGPFDEQLDSMVWTSHPYGMSGIGWMSDLRMLSMADAQRFFETFYAPNNLTAALVGNFDPAEVRRLAGRYFGRIPRGRFAVPDLVTLEESQLAEKRMNAECDCQPQVQVIFHTVPFGHRDSYALDVVDGLLNGQTGRLNKKLVLEKGIASTSSCGQESQKWAGLFVCSADVRGDATPGDLEAALLVELARLASEPIPDEELQKVKNQVVAGSYRRLQSPFFLMLQLLIYDGNGDWMYLNQWADRTLAVTAADVQRVIGEYFTAENRTVATYRRKAGTAAEPVPAELAALPPPAQKAITAQLGQIRAATDPAELEQALAAMAQQKGAVPPEYAPAMELVERTIQQRLAELRAAGEQKEEKP